MAANIAYTQQSRDDMTEAHDWYEQDRPGRGEKFLDRVEECCRAVCRSPRAYSVLTGPYRKAKVPKFPYIAVYRYDPATNLVVLYTVWHTSRDQHDLIDRLP